MSGVNKRLAQQLTEFGRYEAMTHTHDRPVSITSINDAVNHPSHYHPDTIEAIEAIEAWNLGFNLGNAATETIGGIRFSFGGSTSIVSHDISHYGMVNNR